MAKTHPINCHAAEMVAKEFHLENIFIDEVSMFTSNSMHDAGSSFGFARLLDTFEVFGHLMKRIKIDYFKFTDERSEQINTHLNRFAADSLIEIELHYFNDQTSKGFTGPFNKVEVVRMRFSELKSTELNFAVTFPAVKIFDFPQPNILPPPVIEHHFPNLEEMRFERQMQCGSPEFKRRLELNPQLRALHTLSVNWKGLRMISKLLPDIERLDFITFSVDRVFEGDDIEFRKLKVFEIDGVHSFPHYLTRIPIVFGNLEEFTCKSVDSKCFDVIIKNRHLKKIRSSHFCRDQLQQMAEQLVQLEELHCSYFSAAADDMKNFVENRPTLNKIVFTNTDAEICNAIAEQLNGFSFTKEDGFMIFTRNPSSEVVD